MAKRISYIKHELSFPPWSLNFDALGRSKIVVGGGGGGGQKEIPNKLEVYDFSTPGQLKKVASVDVPEDSVSSSDVLAVEQGAIVYAAVNGQDGKHLRTYDVQWPKKLDADGEKEQQGHIFEYGRSRLFAPSYGKDAFQRITRLSRIRDRTKPSRRIGAIASSLAAESELVVFDATSPSNPAVIQRIHPIGNKEVNDLDIMEEPQGRYTLAYCTQNELYTTRIQLDTATMRPQAPLADPACVYTTPHPDASSKLSRPKLRSLRFLAPDLVLVLVNVGNLSELQLFRLFGAGDNAEIVLRKRLPKSVGQAVSLDVSLLDPSSAGEYQILIAVAAQRSDVLLYTVDYPGPQKAVRGPFNHFAELTTGDSPMKKVVLSSHFSPSKNSNAEQPQYLRLASCSLSNTLCLDTIPLIPLSDLTNGSGSGSGSSSSPRYIVQKPGKPSRLAGLSSAWIAVAVWVVLTAFLAQNYYAQVSAGKPTQVLPRGWSDAIQAYRARATEMSSPLARRAGNLVERAPAGRKILDLLHAHHADSGHLPDPARKAIVLSHHSHSDSDSDTGSGLSTEVHDSPADVLRADVRAKRWEELSKEERGVWTGKLKRAGAWSAEYGEGIFKGVFFSELGLRWGGPLQRLWAVERGALKRGSFCGMRQ